MIPDYRVWDSSYSVSHTRFLLIIGFGVRIPGGSLSIINIHVARP